MAAAASGADEADYDEVGGAASGAGSQKESGGEGAASRVETAGEGDEASTSTLYYVVLLLFVGV